MATAIHRPKNFTVMMACPIWFIQSQLGRVHSGRVEINIMTRRLCVFDEIEYSPDLLPIPPAVQDIPLHGDGMHIRFNPVRSANNNFRMGKITVNYIGGDHFTFLVSIEDCNFVMEMMSRW